MKTYLSQTAVNACNQTVTRSIQTVRSFFAAIKIVSFSAILIIGSARGYSQELTVSKSVYQHRASFMSLPANKNKNHAKPNQANSSNVSEQVLKMNTEKDLEVVEGSFTALLENRKTIISWSTIQDLHTDFYIIERSVNGQPFKEIAQVFTSPEPQAKFDYQYIDKLTPEIKGPIYYRIKTVNAEKQVIYAPTQLATPKKDYDTMMASVGN